LTGNEWKWQENYYKNIIKQNYYKRENDLDYHTIISLVSSLLGLCVMMNISTQDGSLPSVFFIAYHEEENKISA